MLIPKQYRDPAIAENCFDELKNQSGWRGYTSRRLFSNSLIANLIVLFYNTPARFPFSVYRNRKHYPHGEEIDPVT